MIPRISIFILQMTKNGQVIIFLLIKTVVKDLIKIMRSEYTFNHFLFLQEWCQFHSDFQSGDHPGFNSTSSQGATFASFTPSTIERINLCVFHVSIAFFGCALSVPILIYAKSNASAARFKLVNNFIVYICLVSLMLSILQLGFGIR